MRLGFFGGRDATLADLQSQVGPGWSDILARLVTDLFSLGWTGCVIQIKEKFGALRFQGVPGENDAMRARISQAEAESYKTCEKCGKPGALRGGSWLKTLCDEHAEGREVVEL